MNSHIKNLDFLSIPAVKESLPSNCVVRSRIMSLNYCERDGKDLRSLRKPGRVD